MSKLYALIHCVTFLIMMWISKQMESIITSIRKLLDELEEKMQNIPDDYQIINSKYRDIDSDNQDGIKEYVEEIIREINILKENKKNRNRDDHYGA